MKKTNTKIGLYNRKYVVSFYDLTTDDGTDSAIITYDDISTPDTRTVADVYDNLIADYLELLSQTDGTDVVSYGRYSRAGNAGDTAYVSWTEQIREYREYYSTLEHTDLISLYAYVDGHMVLIPYSNEPVTAVTIEDEDWDI